MWIMEKWLSELLEMLRLLLKLKVKIDQKYRTSDSIKSF